MSTKELGIWIGDILGLGLVKGKTILSSRVDYGRRPS